MMCIEQNKFRVVQAKPASKGTNNLIHRRYLQPNNVQHCIYVFISAVRDSFGLAQMVAERSLSTSHNSEILVTSLDPHLQLESHAPHTRLLQLKSLAVQPVAVDYVHAPYASLAGFKT